ncbi:MAG: MaoC/PaaZ C-terminal domain-containing protein [Actinomycetota bacterium]|jgi:acyl dehydratase
MPIDPNSVGAQSDAIDATWSSTDCLLYALGVGAGAVDPIGSELEYTTENSLDVEQRVLPTFPVVLGIDALRGVYPKIGPFDHAMLVHAEQSVTLHGRLPVEGRVTTQATISGIYDKGSGAVVSTDTTGVDVATGQPLFTLGASVFIRGEGGWGGDRGPGKPADPPDRRPDHEITYATRADQALLYRLSGDRNPLHSDPKYAAKAGFGQPILHGLCTYGFTGRALLHALCDGDSDRFGAMSGRFSKPVLPGDQLTVSIWALDDGGFTFRTANQQGETVIDAGRFSLRS